MKNVDELIQELCPNGVKKELLVNVVGKISTGKLNANAMVEDGEYPFFTCDANPYRISTYAFDTEAILVSGNGSQVGHINYYKGKFNAYQRTYVLSDFININVNYVLHYLTGNLRKYILIYSKKGSVPYITLPMLQNFLIPVPPLPVQEEIVRILDNFTELTAELTAELTIREKEYEYYRKNLLTFDDKHFLCKKIQELCPDGVEYKKLSDITSLTTGERITKAIMDDTGDYYVYGGGVQPTGKYIKSNFSQSITISRAGSAGFVNWVEDDFWATDVCFVSSQKKNCPKIKYIYYCVKNRQKDLKKKTYGGNLPKLNKDYLWNLSIPVPPLPVQEEIVHILDDFTDYISELKKEIVLRNKEYEYYRDKLLTFKEKPAK